MSTVSQNISIIKNKISEAVTRAKREDNTIKLIAVTKTVGIEKIKEAIDQGIKVFGENRIQEARKKIDHFKDISNIEWHMIGHLQTNKVKHINNFNLIHSIDSLRLAEEINRLGEASKKQINILVQVNIAQEKTKFGINTENLEKMLKQLLNLKNISVKGIMNIPPFFSDQEESRPFFRHLRLLKDELNLRVEGLGLTELSMGMSHDYEIAIEEGATMVRIGSAIFGNR